MQQSTSILPKLDAMAAWNTAVALVTSNRDVLLAVAGVFFMLPNLAFAIFVPEPEIAPDLDRTAALDLVREYYVGALPWLSLVTIAQMAGTLALLIVMTDRARPTVGEALRRGLGATPFYLMAQLLFAVAFGLVFGTLLALGALTGVPALAIATTAVAIAAMIHVFLRLLLVAPVLAVEGERNPVALLKRSWDLTRGQAFRLAAFFGLSLILFLVIVGLAMMFIGLVLALATSGEIERVIAAVFSTAFTAVAMVYFTAMVAAVHRQLSGIGGDGGSGAPFA